MLRAIRAVTGIKIKIPIPNEINEVLADNPMMRFVITKIATPNAIDTA